MSIAHNTNDLPGRPPINDVNLEQDEPQIHVSGIFIVLLEVALVIENTLPILVVVSWLPSCARGVGDRLIAAFSVTCILSALIPTPLGLASYFTGSWYGGSPTCDTYQVTSIWCNLSGLALLCYMCVNCHFAVSRLWNFRIDAPRVLNNPCHQQQLNPSHDYSNPNTNSTRGEFQSSTRQAECSHQTPDVYNGDNSNNENRPSSQANSLQSTHDNTKRTDIRSHANTNHVEMEHSIINPGTSLSSFESSKLEFLSENVQCVNAMSRGQDTVYDKVRGVSKINSMSHDPRDIQLKQPDHENETGNHTSNSRITPSEYNYDHADSHLQHSSSQETTPPTMHYDALQKSSVPEKQNTNCSHGSNHFHCILSSTEPCFIYENSTFLYANSSSLLENNKTDSDNSNNQQIAQNLLVSPKPRLFKARDYVSIALFFLYSITLTISSLPVVGFGPQHDLREKLCRSWLVPNPQPHRERVFFIAFLTCVYACLLIGCVAAARVGFLVNKRIKQEMRRTTRLYHEEENIPDIREFSVIDDLKRHHSLSCLAVCGILTWLPIAIMLTLQKSGVHISEATLVYSNIATSLPCLLNPLLYSLILARYREGYKAILERCRRKKKPQKPHQLRNFQQCCGHEMAVDTGVISSSDGHRCVHGQPNPTFDSCSFDEDILIEEDGDDNNDDDDDEDFNRYFYNKVAKNTLNNPRISEKTPLQTSHSAALKQGKSSDVRGSGGVHNKRHWSYSTSQSKEDEKCLLANEIVKQENETPL